MEIKFTDKRVLITGGCGGIGRALITRLIGCGAYVIAVDCRAQDLRQLETEFAGHIETLCVDLQDWSATARALETVGRIDLLVNNAGVCVLQGCTDITEEALDKQFSINTKAVINISQFVAKNLVKDKRNGAIVNISSQSSQRPLRDHLVYCATKAAVDQITRVLALELAPLVRVNAVNPTIVWTDMEPEEVADAVAFLLSERSSMITGQCLAVDGGFLIS